MDATVDVDELWKTLGVWRKYHFTQLTILYLSLVPISYPVLIWVFVGETPPFQCKPLTKQLEEYNIGYYGNASDYDINYGKCDLTIRPLNRTANDLEVPTKKFQCLEGYSYDTIEGKTVPMEWDLVCNRAGLGEMSTTMVSVGMMFGAFLFTSLADRYGRKPVHVILHALLFAANIGLAFVPVFPLYAAIRLIIGALQQGVRLTITVMTVELFPREWRGLLGGVSSTWWSLCVCSLTVIGYFMRNFSWRYIQLVTAAVSLPSFLSYWFLDKSVRWMVVNNKKDQVIAVVKKAARLNKVDPALVLSSFDDSELSTMSSTHCSETRAQTTTAYSNDTPSPTKNDKSRSGIARYTFLDILKNKILFRNSCILWYTWLVVNMAYYGLFLNTNELPVNKYINYFINGVMEFPAVFFYMFIINRLGRKKTSIIFHGIAGIPLIISVALMSYKENNTANVMSVVFNYIGKMGVSAAFNTIYMYTPELYPTNLRNVGIGTASSFARIGAMISPYSGILASYAIWIPGVLFGSCCIIVMFLMFLLPETCGHTLPQTIEELVEWTKEQSVLGKKRNLGKNDKKSTDHGESECFMGKVALEGPRT